MSKKKKKKYASKLPKTFEKLDHKLNPKFGRDLLVQLLQTGRLFTRKSLAAEINAALPEKSKRETRWMMGSIIPLLVKIGALIVEEDGQAFRLLKPLIPLDKKNLEELY